jgi:hypothetical protein
MVEVMHYDEFDILPPSTVARDVGTEAIRLARSILRGDPGIAAALRRHPELANLSASAIVMLGGRVLKDLLSRCRTAEEIHAHLEHAANEELGGPVIDVDAK